MTMSDPLPAPATEDWRQQYTASSQFTGIGQSEAVQTPGATLQQKEAYSEHTAREAEPKKGLESEQEATIHPALSSVSQDSDTASLCSTSSNIDGESLNTMDWTNLICNATALTTWSTGSHYPFRIEFTNIILKIDDSADDSATVVSSDEAMSQCSSMSSMSLESYHEDYFDFQ
jgi:hypothetical protein